MAFFVFFRHSGLELELEGDLRWPRLGFHGVGIHGGNGRGFGEILRGQRGESATVPGLQDAYEAPVNPEVRVDTTQLSTNDAAGKIREYVRVKYSSLDVERS